VAFHDLTMPLGPGTPVFPGDPGIALARWERARPWHVTSLAFGSHCGTHMDAPRHLLPDGPTIDRYPPDRWIGEAVVIPAGAGENAPIPASILAGGGDVALRGRFALLATGWDRHATDPDRHFRHPWLSPELAQRLVDLGATLVGIDAPSVDSTVSGGDAAHRILLGNGVLIVENLRALSALPAWTALGASFSPLLLERGDGAPIRAVAWDLPGPIRRS